MAKINSRSFPSVYGDVSVMAGCVSNFSVSDGEYSAATDATITITLTDENDVSPVFDPAEYTVSFTSNFNNGSYITMFLIKYIGDIHA